MLEDTDLALDEGTETTFRIADDFDLLDGSILGEMFSQRLHDFPLVDLGREAVKNNVTAFPMALVPTTPPH